MVIEDLLQTNGQLAETKKLVLNLILTANILNEKMQEVLKPFGMSSQQFNVLRILRGRKGQPANLETLQQRMVSKMSNTTRLVDKLVDKNYCHRVTCPSNRRKIEITITQAGLDILDKIDPLVESMENRFSKRLNNDELINLNTTIDELRNANQD